MSVSISPGDKEDVYFFMCSSTEYTKLLRDFTSVEEQLCGHIDESDCFIITSIKNNYTHEEIIPVNGIFHLFLINCIKPETSITYNVEYKLLNDKNQHLSSGEIPLPIMFIILVIVWFIFTSIWFLNWFYFKFIKIKLHYLLLFIPLLKLICLSFNLYYWKSLSIHGNLHLSSTFIYYFLSLIWYTFFFIVLLLIGKGYGITRYNLNNIEFQSIIITIFCLVSSLLVYKIIGSYYLFSLLIMYIVFLKFLFASITYNLNSLKSQLLLIRHHRIDASSTFVFNKFQLFKALQTIMVTWTFVQALIVVVIIFFLSNVLWIEVLLEELLQLYVCLGVSFIFRLRNFYSTSSNNNNNNNNNQLTGISNNNINSNNNNNNEEDIELDDIDTLNTQINVGIEENEYDSNKVIVIQQPPTLLRIEKDEYEIVPSVTLAYQNNEQQ